MSSAFLYLAIVAIWAVFLVPAWLRRPQGHRHRRGDEADVSGGERLASAADVLAGDLAGDAGQAATQEPALRAAVAVPHGAPAAHGALASAVTAATGTRSAPAFVHSHGADGSRRSGADPGPGSDGEPPDRHDAGHEQPGWTPPEQGRQRMLRARRRMLITLIMLTVAAAGAAKAGLADPWICIPPAGILVFYLLLLREVAIADAEFAQSRQAAMQARAARQRAMREHPAGRGRASSQPTATIIDISSRVGDQLYDQYADAAARAVGD